MAGNKNMESSTGASVEAEEPAADAESGAFRSPLASLRDRIRQAGRLAEGAEGSAPMGARRGPPTGKPRASQRAGELGKAGSTKPAERRPVGPPSGDGSGIRPLPSSSPRTDQADGGAAAPEPGRDGHRDSRRPGHRKAFGRTRPGGYMAREETAPPRPEGTTEPFAGARPATGVSGQGSRPAGAAAPGHLRQPGRPSEVSAAEGSGREQPASVRGGAGSDPKTAPFGTQPPRQGVQGQSASAGDPPEPESDPRTAPMGTGAIPSAPPSRGDASGRYRLGRTWTDGSKGAGANGPPPHAEPQGFPDPRGAQAPPPPPPPAGAAPGRSSVSGTAEPRARRADPFATTEPSVRPPPAGHRGAQQREPSARFRTLRSAHGVHKARSLHDTPPARPGGVRRVKDDSVRAEVVDVTTQPVGAPQQGPHMGVRQDVTGSFGTHRPAGSPLDPPRPNPRVAYPPRQDPSGAFSTHRPASPAASPTQGGMEVPGGPTTAPRVPRPVDAGMGEDPSSAWADVDTMLIPREVLNRPGLFGSLGVSTRRALHHLLIGVGLSSHQADETTRRAFTHVALGLCVVVTLVALFADQWVVDRREERVREAELQAAIQRSSSARFGEEALVVSIPPQADVVADGMLIGRTPLSVVRGKQDALLLVRRSGYEAQMIRVGPSSPPQVKVVLKPIQ
ncbi:MAG: hypothetical protein OXU20_41015 [Myxococcales bacterium]|nr:hypothetical protein [Myxococcales bacterium]